MLAELELNLQIGICQNYWIPGINLIENLTTLELVSKYNLLRVIIKNPKSFVADEWLEYSRCIRKQCCYCGHILYSYVAHIVETTNDGCGECICCRIKCNYDENSCCSSNQYNYDPLSLDVY